MRIFFDNVDFSSSSGPNSFGVKLASALVSMGHQITHESPDAQLSFIQANVKLAPTVLRLDGIYFNNEQDWKAMNDPIKSSYDRADAVVVQSDFNRRLITKYFGEHSSIHIIRNGTALDVIDHVTPATVRGLNRDQVWLCASSWRPHKRLVENIRYFHENAPNDAVLLVAGNNIPDDIGDPRISALGNLSWQQLISVMKASSHFLHLAWLDHCPNVVVDARAAGCHIVCSSSGGTEEIAGLNSTVIEESPWDFKPVKLYKPPPLDFNMTRSSSQDQQDIDILKVAQRYMDVLNIILARN